MKYKALHNFSSRPPAEMLLEVLYLKKRKEKGEPIEIPLITVMLYNKSAISGFLVDFKKEESRSSHLTMELVGSSDIFFAETSAIEGLIIHDVEKIDYLLSDIDLDQIAFKKQVTRYEVKKRVTEETERLTAYFGKTIKLKIADDLLDKTECFYLKNLVTDISITMLTLGENEDGRKAIKDAIDDIIIKEGPALKIYIQSGSLFIVDTLARSYTTNAQRGRLNSAITEVL